MLNFVARDLFIFVAFIYDHPVGTNFMLDSVPPNPHHEPKAANIFGSPFSIMASMLLGERSHKTSEFLLRRHP